MLPHFINFTYRVVSSLQFVCISSENNSSKETSRTATICISFSISGYPSPVSHFETDCLVTAKHSANSSCVFPDSLRANLRFLPKLIVFSHENATSSCFIITSLVKKINISTIIRTRTDLKSRLRVSFCVHIFFTLLLPSEVRISVQPQSSHRKW